VLLFELTPASFLFFIILSQYVSLINAACGVIHLMVLVVLVLLKVARKVGAFCRNSGESCCGLFRLIGMLLDMHGE
jgi:hypothetical protein